MDFLIHHMLRTSAERSPEKEALVHRDERLSYGEVWAKVQSLAAGLERAGVHRGDRVGIYLEASIPQAIAIFAVSATAGVFVPINRLLFPEQVAHIAQMSQAIRRRFGTRVLLGACELFTYPSPERLAAASETELRECRLGFAEPQVQPGELSVDVSEGEVRACRPNYRLEVYDAGKKQVTNVLR